MKYNFFLIIISIFLHNSCKTVSPTAVNDVKHISPNSNHAQKKTLKIYSANFRYFSIKKSNAEKIYEISFKSEAELFCETLCSKFEIKRSDQDSLLNFEIARTPIAGNTTPGSLDSNEILNLKDIHYRKILLKNFAKNQHNILVDILPNEVNQKIEIALAEISSSMAIGGESSGYQVNIDGKNLTAQFKSQEIAKQLSTINLSTPRSVIIIGEQKTTEGVERGVYPVFEIASIELIQTED